MSKAAFIGWIISLAAAGNQLLIYWHAFTPWRIEIGMALVCAGMIPIYWPSRRAVNDQTTPLDRSAARPFRAISIPKEAPKEKPRRSGAKCLGY
jgi:hypothetical protein